MNKSDIISPLNTTNTNYHHYTTDTQKRHSNLSVFFALVF
ncbi:hypothetical protein HMPREF1504_1278 [Veillonella sp. ICM51a]|nr:hypothetical protein HMPREF1504_1278 [Veillonella sp. ICM51a]DAP39186.1 MAG TPA: hypothetical protein [Caudoviricetes sp.]DAX79201.1 MAG TPA: hypothetical protein [Caudoviricetes sp.]